jgi:hypothetical protein
VLELIRLVEVGLQVHINELFLLLLSRLLLLEVIVDAHVLSQRVQLLLDLLLTLTLILIVLRQLIVENAIPFLDVLLNLLYLGLQVLVLIIMLSTQMALSLHRFLNLPDLVLKRTHENLFQIFLLVAYLIDE